MSKNQYEVYHLHRNAKLTPLSRSDEFTSAWSTLAYHGCQTQKRYHVFL